jgi:hypothetical protein
MDEDVMAAMGISGFGKQTRKRQLDAARFDKAKREEVLSSHFILKALLTIRRRYLHLRLLKEGVRISVHLSLRPVYHHRLGFPALQARMLTLRSPPPLHQSLGQGNLLRKSQSMTQMRNMASLVKRTFLSFPQLMS